MTNIAPLSGWMLDRVVEMDAVHAGFAGFVFRASPERRQVMAAFIATMDLAENSEEAASFLMKSRHHTILEMAFGFVPTGFRSALGRSGSQAHNPDYYRQLWALLMRGPTHAVSVVRHSNNLDPDRLAIIVSMPCDLCSIRIVERLNKTTAADLALAINFMADRGLDRRQIIAALHRSNSLTDTIRRWGYRIPFPRGPIPVMANYRPVTDGVELAAISKRYRNCSRRYFDALMSGEHAFGEFTCGENAVILSFDRSQGFWVIAGVHSYNNGAVPAAVSVAAYQFAASHGVLDRKVRDRRDKSLEALRRLSGRHFDWDV